MATRASRSDSPASRRSTSSVSTRASSRAHKLTVRATPPSGKAKEFKVLARIDTPEEMNYYKNGGILPYVLRQLVSGRS